jgi:hypothetical protein
VLPPAVNGNPYVVLLFNDYSPGQLYEGQKPGPVAAVTPSCPRMFVMESHFGSPTGSLSQRAKYLSLENLNQSLRLYYRTQTIKVFAGVAVQVFTRVSLPH